MAAHAGEAAAVAEGTADFWHGLSRMGIFEARRVMIGGLQVRPLGIVALGAAEGRVDLVVAYQAIGHLRHVGVADMIGSVDSTMARKTGIGGIQMRPNIIYIGQVGLFIDGRGNYRCDVAQLQMLGMAEMGDWRRSRPADGPALMARLADGRGGQQIILRRSAGGYGGVAIHALLLQLQVQLMGKLLAEKRAGQKARQTERS